MESEGDLCNARQRLRYSIPVDSSCSIIHRLDYKARVPKPRTIQVWNMPEESNKIFRCGVDLSSRFHFHFTTFLHHHRRKKKHEKLFNAKMPAGHDVKKFFVASLISRRVVEDYFRATLENFPILRYNASQNWWIAQAEEQEKSLFRSGFFWVALAR